MSDKPDDVERRIAEIAERYRDYPDFRWMVDEIRQFRQRVNARYWERVREENAKLQAQLRAARNDNARLREALNPFADCAYGYVNVADCALSADFWPHDERKYTPRVSDFRRARAALTATPATAPAHPKAISTPGTLPHLQLP